MAAVFSHGQLRLYLLSIVAERPRHGYDIIKALSDQFAGTYEPSPGTIYPRLAKLVDEGLVTKSADGRRTVYSITQAGRAELDGRDVELAEVVTDIASTVEERAGALRDEVAESMAALKVDLLGQASAPPASQASAPPATADPLSARYLLKQAEVYLDVFRATTRADLRVAAAHAKLTAEAVETLHADLDAATARLRSMLPS